MITEPSLRTRPDWQQALADSFTRPAELLDYLALDPRLPTLRAVELRDFPLRVPRGYAARMKKGDPGDPLFRQVWPSPRESERIAGFVADAVGELERLAPGGVIRKYAGRVLLVATGTCAINCRFCFRRHFPYRDHLAARDHWRVALSQIAGDRSIEEVILSGGDPLSLSDDKLAELAQALEFLPHVKRLRIHTRQPIVLPERVDDALLAWLGRGRVRKIVVIHANHAQELDATVDAALRRLAAAGVPLLNQSVLLAGVNDSADALCSLSLRLFDCGVLPYYLHLLDRVRGVAHFEVSTERARALMREVQSRLPGYLVPRLAQEEPGMPAKMLLTW